MRSSDIPSVENVEMFARNSFGMKIKAEDKDEICTNDTSRVRLGWEIKRKEMKREKFFKTKQF